LTAFLRDGAVAWLRGGDGMVGLGEFARLERGQDAAAWWREISQRVRHDDPVGAFGSGPVAFASFVFDPVHTAAESVAVVPEIVIGRRRGQAWLTQLVPGDVDLDGLRTRAPRRASPACGDQTGPIGGAEGPAAEPAGRTPAEAEARLLGRASSSGPRRAPVTGSAEVRPRLSRAAWEAAVAEAVARLDDTFTKTVLARAVDVDAAEAIDPHQLAAWLSNRYQSCWTYHLDGLVGATPELLVRLERGLATSRVLAGTIRRSGDGELDLKAARALTRSSKNLVEHELAVQSVAQALAPHCSAMNVPEAPFVLELPNVLHLASDITGVAANTDALRLVEALHPSAAVCGTPKDQARRAIAELEQLDRGRYAGPVGWVGADGAGEFGIALRCGQLSQDGHRVTLYAGCGIVAGSDPAEEFAETEAKLIPMLEALGVGAAYRAPVTVSQTKTRFSATMAATTSQATARNAGRLA
jgi:menaquinone-specific isochorismate synthase